MSGQLIFNVYVPKNAFLLPSYIDNLTSYKVLSKLCNKNGNIERRKSKDETEKGEKEGRDIGGKEKKEEEKEGKQTKEHIFYLPWFSTLLKVLNTLIYLTLTIPIKKYFYYLHCIIDVNEAQRG